MAGRYRTGVYIRNPLVPSYHSATTQPPTSQRVAAPSTRVANAPPPRVATTSNNITAPNVIRNMPLVHQRQTRNNNPFHILSDDDDDDDTVVASNCSPRDPPPTLPTSDLRASTHITSWKKPGDSNSTMSSVPNTPPTLPPDAPPWCPSSPTHMRWATWRR